MQLIVGLGNPGEKYARTRHNVGFMVTDALAGEKNWERKSKFAADICRLRPDVLLIKPQTYMNHSGQAVSQVVQFYDCPVDQVVVIHDDVDLPLGKLQIKRGGGSAGHHGIESVAESIGSTDFVRFRLGIGKGTPEQEAAIAACRLNISDFVLLPFARDEKPAVDRMIARASEAVPYFLEQGLEKTMSQYNKRV